MSFGNIDSSNADPEHQMTPVVTPIRPRTQIHNTANSVPDFTAISCPKITDKTPWQKDPRQKVNRRYFTFLKIRKKIEVIKVSTSFADIIIPVADSEKSRFWNSVGKNGLQSVSLRLIRTNNDSPNITGIFL